MKENQKINTQMCSDSDAVKGLTGIVSVTVAALIFLVFGSKIFQNTATKQCQDGSKTTVLDVKQSEISKDSADFAAEYKKMHDLQKATPKTR